MGRMSETGRDRRSSPRHGQFLRDGLGAQMPAANSAVEGCRIRRRAEPLRSGDVSTLLTSRFHTRRITHATTWSWMENLISYNGAPWMYTGNLLEFCGSQLRSNEGPARGEEHRLSAHHGSGVHQFI
jgi:hypothetical protein